MPAPVCSRQDTAPPEAEGLQSRLAPITIQPGPSFLLVKAFSVLVCPVFSLRPWACLYGLSLLLGQGGALRSPGRPSILAGGEGRTCRTLPWADPAPPKPPPTDTSRELKTLCEEEEEGRVQPQQAGEAQAGVVGGLDFQTQGPGPQHLLPSFP